tara:strand:- start:398 stop:664 length:267 start_codon:yes stop_codon:yes gene_type:complete
MNTFQIIMLSISGLLVLSVFWEKIILFFSAIKKPKEVANQDATTLVEVVSDWEKLKKSCKANQLNQAVKALKNIFPLLVIEEGDSQDV